MIDGKRPALPYDITILIVEDDVLIAWAVEGMLRDMGFSKIIIASTGESAMSAAEAEPLGLIFCDLNLGPLTVNGIELLDLIDPDEAIPTIVHTGYGGKEIDVALNRTRPKARRLVKPAGEAQLALAVRELLEMPAQLQATAGVARSAEP